MFSKPHNRGLSGLLPFFITLPLNIQIISRHVFINLRCFRFRNCFRESPGVWFFCQWSISDSSPLLYFGIVVCIFAHFFHSASEIYEQNCVGSFQRMVEYLSTIVGQISGPPLWNDPSWSSSILTLLRWRRSLLVLSGQQEVPISFLPVCRTLNFDVPTQCPYPLPSFWAIMLCEVIAFFRQSVSFVVIILEVFLLCRKGPWCYIIRDNLTSSLGWWCLPVCTSISRSPTVSPGNAYLRIKDK